MEATISAIVRLGDICSGHSGFPPRPSVSGSPDTFINGLQTVTVGSVWAVHCNKSCHSGIQASGSPNVFVNGLSIARIGDVISCGSTCAIGSANTFAN